MEKLDILYEGKAKKVFSTSNENLVIIYYKDDATAFNAQKKGIIGDKGVLNNKISSLIYSELENNGVKTHFKKQLSEREQLCEKLNIIPLEVIVRNLIAGSLAKRLALEEGTSIDEPIIEICYKNDSLGDPLINDYHAICLNLVSKENLKKIYEIAIKINKILINLFDKADIKLIDFKIEFGINEANEIVLADEISPDTCRLWNKNNNYRLDKDRFRRDLGDIKEAYVEVLNRLKSKI